ncbi:MAG TPA: pyrroloquinoline quinone precursor peptide PqqA [Steroidobacteraceae bacterium]
MRSFIGKCRARDGERHRNSAAAFATHENHEARFMMIRFPAPARFGEDGYAGSSGPDSRDEELVMKWETPQAIDLRFGMEITMYIAHR